MAAPKPYFLSNLHVLNYTPAFHVSLVYTKEVTP